MLNGESIDDMLTWFTNITNGLISESKPNINDQKVRKIIRALPKTWEVRATTLKELNDKEEIDFTDFVRNLKTHEMEMKAREDREPQKKVSVAFKASPKELKKKSVATATTSDDEQEDDEELTLFVENMRRIYHKSQRRSDQKEWWQGKKREKKPMKATTWDSDSESESKIDSAHMCCMV